MSPARLHHAGCPAASKSSPKWSSRQDTQTGSGQSRPHPPVPCLLGAAGRPGAEPRDGAAGGQTAAAVTRLMGLATDACTVPSNAAPVLLCGTAPRGRRRSHSGWPLGAARPRPASPTAQGGTEKDPRREGKTEDRVAPFTLNKIAYK